MRVTGSVYDSRKKTGAFDQSSSHWRRGRDFIIPLWLACHSLFVNEAFSIGWGRYCMFAGVGVCFDTTGMTEVGVPMCLSASKHKVTLAW